MAHWKYHIEGWGTVFHEGNIAEDTPEDTLALRDKLVRLLRESDWYTEQPDGEDSALAQAVRELAATDDAFDVGNLIIAIYDLADAERAWLDPGLDEDPSGANPPDWDIPSLAYLWDSPTRAIMAGADKLESLDEADFERSLAALADRVGALAERMDDQMLLTTAFVMVEDLFKSFFNQFRWTPGVAGYITATAGVLMKEVTQRGFVVNYVVDNTLGEANLAEVLTYMPQMFQAAGLVITGPQLMAVELMEHADNRPRDLGMIAAYRREGNDVADDLIAIWHQQRKSSVYLNMDFDDDAPALSMDVALSQRNTPGTLVVFRNQLPVAGTKSELTMPPGIELPDWGQKSR